MTDDPLWTFACELYGRPGVAEACLALQDAAGVDVPLLIYLIWCTRTGRPVDAAEVVRANARVAPWRKQVVEPLRAIRRAMRSDLLPGQPTQAHRERIKAAELEAERLALAALSAAAPEQAEGGGWGTDVLALYAAHLGRPWPDAHVRALRAALAAF
jgi:uncharacterized protein (TIGR02444 family)